MDKKRVWGIVISFFLLVVSAYLLITASPLLTLGLDEADTIPLGTFITWIGIIAFPCFLFFITGALFRPTNAVARLFSKLMKVFIFVAILWAPIATLLAGNLSFSFSEKSGFQGGQLAMQIFWYFSYFLVLGPLIGILLYKLLSIFISFNKEDT